MQIGVIVPDLDYNQLTFCLLHQIHKISADTKCVPIIFQQNVVIPYIVPMCACINIAEIYSFKGVLVTTNLEDTKLAINTAKMAKDILFYVWDLEWLRDKKNFLDNYKLMSQVKLIVQNEYHAQAIQKYSGLKPLLKIENIDIQKIAEEYEHSKS